MSEENVKVVIGVFEAVNVRDFAAAMDAYAEDVTLTVHADIGAVAGHASGKRAVGEWFGDWFRQFAPDYRFEVHEARDLGDRVFLVATHHGRGRAIGVPVTQRLAYVYSVDDGGKISQIEAWAEREPALEAAGLSG